VTVLVGVLCSNGVVLGADGAATFGFLGNHTARHPTRKLVIVDGELVIGSSGFVGLSQRVAGAVAQAWRDRKPGFQGVPAFEVGAALAEVVRQHLVPELLNGAKLRPALGDSSMDSAVCLSLLALPIGENGFSLLQLGADGAPEFTTPELPFIAMGSGSNIADPFLAFLRRVFWPQNEKRLPTVNDGIFTVLWALQHAIETNTGGVADPKQVVVLEKSLDACTVRELADGEFQEHLQAIAAAERALADFRKFRPEEPAAKPPRAESA
jgi:20S proteasome alpha/beta subunit